MDAYEKLIKTMRQEGARGVKLPKIALGEMKSARTCTCGGNLLEDDDLLFPEHIDLLEKGDEVVLVQINDEQYAILAKIVD